MNELSAGRPVIWWVINQTSATSSLPQIAALLGSSTRCLRFETALELLPRRPRPRLIFLEAKPDKAGQRALAGLKESAPGVPVLLVSYWEDPGDLQSWFANYLLELSRQRFPGEDEPVNSYGLSRREREVLRRMVRGLIKKEIAEELAISYHTVSNHERHILQKMKVHNRSAAVAKAFMEKII